MPVRYRCLPAPKPLRPLATPFADRGREPTDRSGDAPCAVAVGGRDRSGEGGLFDQADFLREFLRREPDRALRILTTRAGTIQSRLVASIETLLKDEVSQGSLHSPIPLRDLAYLIVRIVESFLYAELITGEEPGIAMAELAVRALLGRQDSERFIVDAALRVGVLVSRHGRLRRG